MYIWGSNGAVSPLYSQMSVWFFLLFLPWLLVCFLVLSILFDYWFVCILLFYEYVCLAFCCFERVSCCVFCYLDLLLLGCPALMHWVVFLLLSYPVVWMMFAPESVIEWPCIVFWFFYCYFQAACKVGFGDINSQIHYHECFFHWFMSQQYRCLSFTRSDNCLSFCQGCLTLIMIFCLGSIVVYGTIPCIPLCLHNLPDYFYYLTNPNGPSFRFLKNLHDAMSLMSIPFNTESPLK